MKDKHNIHLKVQEMADCFATTDPLKEMSGIASESDLQEAAVKWLALATLHGINHNAKEITVKRSSDGNVVVTAEYRDTELPSPGSAVGEKILEAVRRMTHIEEDKGKIPLVLGVRNDSVEIGVKVKRKDSGESVTLKFPG